MGYPQNIISLVPSLTELLFDLGLGDRIVGRTRFCVHPEKDVEKIEVIGGTKNPRIKKIISLEPDLVIANKEENRKEHIDELEKHTDVHLTNITNINEALFGIHLIGEKCGAEDEAAELLEKIQVEMERVPDEPPLSVAYMIWRNPWMTAGGDTYINSVLTHWNLKNVFGDETRYPEITLSDIELKKPDLIFLSSEPYPFKEKHIAEVSNASPRSNVVLVNGEWFSWYGSRMLPAFRQLNLLRKAVS